MPYFEPARETKKIKLNGKNKDGVQYFAVVYTKPKWGESKRFTQLKEDGSVDLVASAGAFLTALIKEWNLDLDDGSIAPITEENVDLLEAEDAMALIKAAGADVEGATAAKKN